MAVAIPVLLFREVACFSLRKASQPDRSRVDIADFLQTFGSIAVGDRNTFNRLDTRVSLGPSGNLALNRQHQHRPTLERIPTARKAVS